jgi:hypothetical protein
VETSNQTTERIIYFTRINISSGPQGKDYLKPCLGWGGGVGTVDYFDDSQASKLFGGARSDALMAVECRQPVSSLTTRNEAAAPTASSYKT